MTTIGFDEQAGEAFFQRWRRTNVRRLYTLSILATVTALAPFAADAAEWWFVGDTTSSAVFVDRESIAPVTHYGTTYAKAWDTVSRSPSAANAVATTKTARYYNCVDRTIGVKNQFDFRKDGAADGETIVPDAALKLRSVDPESVDAALMDFVCNAERSEGDRPDFSNAGRDFLFVGDLDKAAALLTPRPGQPASLSAKARLGIGEAYKPIF